MLVTLRIIVDGEDQQHFAYSRVVSNKDILTVLVFNVHLLFSLAKKTIETGGNAHAILVVEAPAEHHLPRAKSPH